MLKGLLLLLASSLFINPINADLVKPYSDDLTVNNNQLVEVNDKSALEVRIYKDKGVTSVANGAFDGCSFNKIMISSTVREVISIFPDNIVINYTSSLDDIAFDIPNNVFVNEYACDEGFLNYWTTYIRPNIDGSICNVQKNDYLRMKELFMNLSNYDRQIVSNTNDGSGSIAASITYLDRHFSDSPQGGNNKEKEISQSVMITLILIIASFGMTSIGLFYFLKDKKVIE